MTIIYTSLFSTAVTETVLDVRNEKISLEHRTVVVHNKKKAKIQATSTDGVYIVRMIMLMATHGLVSIIADG